MYKLLMHKVGSACRPMDSDAESALAAAGVGTSESFTRLRRRKAA